VLAPSSEAQLAPPAALEEVRLIWTAHKTLAGRTLERPSCGGFMLTAETTLFPAYSARSRRLLTSSARLDNEPNLLGIARLVFYLISENIMLRRQTK
jgi:hypothetical protein